MKWMETAASLVPTGKALSIIATTAVGAFLAGVGWITTTGEVRKAVEAMPSMQLEIGILEDQMVEVQEEIEDARSDRQRILCLVTLTATGESLSPLQVADRCP